MPAITVQQLNDASLDVGHIIDYATSTAPLVTDRFGVQKVSLRGASDRMDAKVAAVEAAKVAATGSITYKVGEVEVAKLAANQLMADKAAAVIGFTDRGAWVTGTPYTVKDVFSNSGTWYVTVIAHTSSASFASDAANVRVFQGVTTGDLAAQTASGVIGHIGSGVGTFPRTVASKLGESVSVEDFYFATDLGKINNAVQRALATGHKEILFTSDEQYLFDNTITVNRPISTTFRTTGDKSVEFVLNGSNDIFFDVGNASTVSYGFHMHNMVFLKQNASTSGAVIRMRNLYNWSLKNTRTYSNHKFWRGLDLYSVGFGKAENNLITAVQREAAYFNGGSADVGAINSRCIQNVFDYTEIDDAHALTANPQDQGVFLFDNYCEANWLTNTFSYRHQGYLAYFKGSPASANRNFLNFVINPNTEATLANSGTVRVGYYSGTVIGGHGWSEGNNIPAIQFDAASIGNKASNMQLNLKGSGGIGILDNGTDNEWTGFSVKGVDTPAQTSGIGYKTGATALRSKGLGRAYYLGSALQNLANDVAGLDIDIDYHSINTANKATGLSSANNYNIRSLVDTAASQFLAAASTISIPHGCESLTIFGVAAIGEITAGYYKQRVTLRLGDSGASVRDINASLKNIILSTAGSTFTSTGRSNITLEWNGDYWWEISRTA